VASSLEKLQQNHPIELHWRSFELRPQGSPPIPPEYQARIEASKPRMVAMARDQYGLEIKQGPFGIDSRPALIGAKYAEQHGVGPGYHDAVFRAYWQQAKDISDLNVLVSIAEGLGLECTSFRAALRDPVLVAAVDEDIAYAQSAGLSGVPALVFNQKYLVSGAQPYPVLEEVLREIDKAA
jgi:predicted DsbA family dithiol-disulfide isomerase